MLKKGLSFKTPQHASLPTR